MGNVRGALVKWREYVDFGLIIVGSKDLLSICSNEEDNTPKIIKYKIGIKSTSSVEQNNLACSMVLRHQQEAYLLTISRNGAFSRMKMERNGFGLYEILNDKEMMLIITDLMNYSFEKPYLF